MNKVYFVLGKGSYLDQPLADNALRLVDRQPFDTGVPRGNLAIKVQARMSDPITT